MRVVGSKEWWASEARHFIRLTAHKIVELFFYNGYGCSCFREVPHIQSRPITDMKRLVI